jgi:nitroimidazol reductase NimA-like FMN-containing flavoprotein (pyridoxamine 5'-phosphate oxidase superfamily)
MHETADDLRRLQQELDRSYAAAGEHHREIFTPERRMSAEEVAEALRGVFVINLATVSAAGEPLVAPLDGLLYRGRIWFGITERSVRARHIRKRPAVSAVHNRGEGLCVIVHGTAREIDRSDPAGHGYRDHAIEVYGADAAGDWESSPGLAAWIEPRRLYATFGHPEVPTEPSR